MSTTQASDEEIILQLAQITPLEYEQQRDAVAKNLNIRVSVLDKLVKEHKTINSETLENNALIFPKIEPWHSEVKSAELLSNLSAFIRKYVILSKHEANTIALWILFTYCIDAANTAPILNICSPEKRCGKSTLIALLDFFVNRSLLASNISPPALFRTVGEYRPTLLLDEADTFITDEKSELRGIINSGHTKSSAFVIRTVGDNHTPQKFSTWCAKCLAGIGNLPDTIMDRSIIIKLRRKLKNETIKKLRHANKEEIIKLKRQCVRFSHDNLTSLSTAQPSIPDQLNDRAADNWEILLSIAELAGEEWSLLAKKAALNLSSTEEAVSTSVELLQDIEDIYAQKKVDRLSSAELLRLLCDDVESPWATYNRGKPMTPRQLSSRLKEFKIVSGSIRLSDKNTPKGYLLKKFIDAFQRYLPSKSATPPQPNQQEDLEEDSHAPQNQLWHHDNTLQTMSDMTCGGVADKKQESMGVKIQCTNCGYNPPFCSCMQPDLNREITGE